MKQTENDALETSGYAYGASYPITVADTVESGDDRSYFINCLVRPLHSAQSPSWFHMQSHKLNLNHEQ